MSKSQLRPRSASVVSHDETTQVLHLMDVASEFADIPADVGLTDLIPLLILKLRRDALACRAPLVESFRNHLDRTAARDEHWLALISVEIEIRREQGDFPALNEYLQRFPELATQLAETFAAPEPNGAMQKDLTSLEVPNSQSGQQERTLLQRVTPLSESFAQRMDIRIPGYEVLGVLGRGGMGIVYKARQLGLNRIVALKMVLNGSHAEREDIARFRLEAEAVAALRHPNIVQVYEIGEHDGTPFFSMEFIEGGSLAQKIAGQPQTPAYSVEIVEALAGAVHVAHQQRIIHRDLKPANILFSIVPNASSVQTTEVHLSKINSALHLTDAGQIPKITDFGLAKRLDVAMHLTTTGLIAGTPQYMAPEQVKQGARESVGPTADVYSLGVILYEMLTGRPPFLGSNPAEIMHNVLRHEPVPVHQLQPKVARDLETICLKCLQKEPHKRYDTADGLAEDLRRYRAGKPILARPVGRIEQGVRWCRRNPTIALLLLLVVLALSSGAAVASLFAIDAAGQARRAEANAREARRHELAAERSADDLRGEKKTVDKAHLQLSQTHATLTDTYKQLTDAHAEVTKARLEEERLKKEAEEREKFRARELFDVQMIHAQRSWETGQVAFTRRLLAAYEPVRHDQPDLRGFEWFYLERLSNADGARYSVPDGCRGIAMSPDGKELIWAFRNTCEIWTLALESTRVGSVGGHPTDGHRAEVERVAYDPTGKLFATASHDHTVKLWDARTRRLVHTLSMGALSPKALRFSTDGKFVACASSHATNFSIPGELRICETSTGVQKHLLQCHSGAIYDCAFSPNGEQIATVGYDDSVKIWNVESGKNEKSLAMPTGQFGRSVAFAPRGSSLAVGTSRGEIIVWDSRTWAEARRLFGHVRAVQAVAFAKDGVSLASAGHDQLVKIWNSSTGEEKRTYRGHTQTILDVAWAPNSRWVFTASRDRSIKGWELGVNPEHGLIRSYWGDLANLHLLPDGQHIAVAGRAGFASVWNLRNATPVQTADFRNDPANKIWHSSLGNAGSRLVLARSAPSDETDSDIWEWDLSDPKPRSMNLPDVAPGIRRVSHNPDGKQLASGHLDGTVQIHSLGEREKPVTWKPSDGQVQDLAFSPTDAKHLLVVGANAPPTLWNIENQSVVRTFGDQTSQARCAAFSSDGKLLATGGDDQSAYLWNVATGRLLFKLSGHTGAVRCLAFSADNERLVTGSADSTVKLWDTRTGHKTLTLRGHTREVVRVLFGPAGRKIVSYAADLSVLVWDAGQRVDRELHRAAAAACRLNALNLEGAPQAGGEAIVHFEIANVSGRRWPVPPQRKTTVIHRTYVRLFAAPVRNGKIDPRDEVLVGQFDMLPVEAIEVGYSYRATLTASLRLLGAGPHRLRLEHGWHGDEIVPISEKVTEIDIEPNPSGVVLQNFESAK